MKAPKPTKLHNVEQWYQTPVLPVVLDVISGSLPTITELPKPIKIATICYGKPYALAKSIKRQEELKNNPKGTYFKIVPH